MAPPVGVRSAGTARSYLGLPSSPASCLGEPRPRRHGRTGTGHPAGGRRGSRRRSRTRPPFAPAARVVTEDRADGDLRPWRRRVRAV